MTKLALGIAAALTLAVTLPSKPAAADRGCTRHCSPLFEAMAWSMAAGIVGGYAYGTGYFIHRDVTDEAQTLEYAGTELGINSAGAVLFGMGAVSSARDGSAGGTLVFGALAAVHTTLAVHGGWQVYEHRSELRPDPDVVRRFAILGYGANTIMWAAQLRADRSRGYGIAEAAVNAPIAAGLGYLAYDRYRDGKTSSTALFGGLAAVSGALAVHGVYTAVAPRRTPKLELYGADLAPTMVSDGREVAPGLGAAGTW
jgi:hypothetical protein